MITQPPKSKLCGHCCLATILNISLQESIDIIGHENGTKSKELSAHLNLSSNRRGIPNVYSLYISRPIDKKSGNWHWVLFNNDMIYDPIIGYYISIEDFTEITGLHISSYFEIKNPN